MADFTYGQNSVGQGIGQGLQSLGQGYLQGLMGANQIAFQRQMMMNQMRYRDAMAQGSLMRGQAAQTNAEGGFDPEGNPIPGRAAAMLQAWGDRSNATTANANIRANSDNAKTFQTAMNNVAGLPGPVQYSILNPLRAQLGLTNITLPGEDVAGHFIGFGGNAQTAASTVGAQPPSGGLGVAPVGAPASPPMIPMAPGASPFALPVPAGAGGLPGALPSATGGNPTTLQGVPPSGPQAPSRPPMGAIPISPATQAVIDLHNSTAQKNKGGVVNSGYGTAGLLPAGEQPSYITAYNAATGGAMPVPGTASTPGGATVPMYAPNALQAANIGQKNSQASVNTARIPLLGGQTDLMNIRVKDQPGLDASINALRAAQGQYYNSTTAKNDAITPTIGPLAASTIARNTATGNAATENAGTAAGRLNLQAKPAQKPFNVQSAVKGYQAVIDKANGVKNAILIAGSPNGVLPQDKQNVIAAQDAIIGQQEHNIRAVQKGVNPVTGAPLNPPQKSSAGVSPASPAANYGSRVLSAANNMTGTMQGENGCASFVCKVMKAAGQPFPNTSNAAQMEKRFGNFGYKQIPASQAQPGDAVTMKGSGPSGRHVGIYAGNGQFLDDPGKSSGYKAARNTLPKNDPTLTAWRYVGQRQKSSQQAPAANSPKINFSQWVP